jgi:hypothetical protein
MKEREGKRCNMENGEQQGLNGGVEWMEGGEEGHFFLGMQRCSWAKQLQRSKELGGRDGTDEMNERMN